MKGSNLNLAYGTEIIYKDASFQLNELDKVGVVGVNGAGKTTLFKVILKKEELDSGKIHLGNKRLGYLPQEILLEDENISVLDYLLSARPIKKLESELATLYEKLAIEDEKAQKDIYKKLEKTQSLLEYYDYYHYETILLDLLEHMQIDIDLLDQKLMHLSGGQKSKIAFARLLYAKPDILLLDEPTNHLDEKTKDFVTSYLKKYKGMILIISHDTAFLDEIVGKILWIDKVSKTINVYSGNYTTYQKLHEEEQKNKEKRIQLQEKEIERLEKFVKKAKEASGTNHKLKKQGKDREIKLQKKKENLEKRDKAYQHIKLDLTPQKTGGKFPLKVNNLTFGYDKRRILNNVSFTIENKERFLVVGENGVGKSTLLKLLVGKLSPQKGTIWYAQNTTIAYYAQEFEDLQIEKTILENIDDGKTSDKVLRNILSNFLFYGDDVNKKISSLSPGEKARVCLCKVLLKRANLLILDEPTNHLDVETEQVIGKNFQDYQGTILMVSHNKEFTKTLGINRMLILPLGKIVNYNEERLDYYNHINRNKQP